MPRGQAYLFPWQVAGQREYGDDRLLRYLPRWLQGPRTRDVAGAIGRQLGAIDGLGLDDQLFVATATWGLAWDAPNADGTTTATGWERDYGLGVRAGDSYATRRARVLGRLQGHAIRTVGEFGAYALALLGRPWTGPAFGPTPDGLMTANSTFARWVVFKPLVAGFPANFRDVEAALALAGPAHLGLYLAPHREAPDTGLTDAQLDLMHDQAIDLLTDAEIDGG
jgi:hypothetical protein